MNPIKKATDDFRHGFKYNPHREGSSNFIRYDLAYKREWLKTAKQELGDRYESEAIQETFQQNTKEFEGAGLWLRGKD